MVNLAAIVSSVYVSIRVSENIKHSFPTSIGVARTAHLCVRLFHKHKTRRNVIIVLIFFFLLERGVFFSDQNLKIKLPGSGANGAIIHYKPEPDNCSIVDRNKLFLLDSGAQYVDGTTDITRTVHFGEPKAWEKECFTRVLQVSNDLLMSVDYSQTYRNGWFLSL